MINSPSPYGNLIADGSITPVKLSANIPQRIATSTLAGAGNTFTFSGLTSSTDRFYKIFVFAEDAAAATGDIRIYVNGDTTSTNYYSQKVNVSNNVLSGTRSNASIIGEISANKPHMMEITATRTVDGFFVAMGNNVMSQGAAVMIENLYVSKTNALVGEITELSIVFAAGNVKAGSTAILYMFP